MLISNLFAGAGTIRVYNARTGRPVGPELETGPGVVLSQFLPNDPTRLVTVSRKELIHWDFSDPQHPRPIGGPLALPENPSSGQPVTIFTISPDGRTVATSATGVDELATEGSTFLWDLAVRYARWPDP